MDICNDGLVLGRFKALSQARMKFSGSRPIWMPAVSRILPQTLERSGEYTNFVLCGCPSPRKLGGTGAFLGDHQNSQGGRSNCAIEAPEHLKTR